MIDRKQVVLALVLLMLWAAPAEAKLCKKCQGKMFTTDIGRCGTCGKGTSSGAFKLCRTCSSKQGKCEACQARLGPVLGAKPGRPIRPPAKPGRPIRPPAKPGAPVAPVAPSRPPRSPAKAEVVCSEGGGFVGPTMEFTMWPDGLWWYRKGIGSKAGTSTGKTTAAQRDAFLKGLADAGLYRTESAKMHPNVPSFQIRVLKGRKWTKLRVAQNHKVAAAVRDLIAALTGKGGQDKTPKGKAKAIAISLKVPDTSWSVKPVGVYQVGKEVWAVWQLTRSRGGMGMMVITTRKSTVYIAPTPLPVKHFILGKRWGWKNSEPYTFVPAGGQDAFKKKLAAGKKLPWSATPDGLVKPPPAGDKPTLAQLSAAPVTVTINGTTVRLQPYLWRNSMPTISRPGRRRPKAGLLVRIKVTATNAEAIPKGLVVDTVWLIRGKEIWQSSLKEVRARTPIFDGMVRGGPPWPTGIKVDVVVRLRDKDGKTYLLRAASQLINRVS